MTDIRNDDLGERLTSVEKRVHTLEDKSVGLKEDVANVERVLGLNGYGEKNLINDLRDALSTIQKLKDGVISTKDFQTLMHDVDTLKKRGQAQIALRDYIMFGIISSMIGIVMQLIMARLITP